MEGLRFIFAQGRAPLPLAWNQPTIARWPQWLEFRVKGGRGDVAQGSCLWSINIPQEPDAVSPETDNETVPRTKKLASCHCQRSNILEALSLNPKPL